jgi:hypothetical protein
MLSVSINVCLVPGTDIRIAMTAMISADFGPRLLQIAKVI